MNKPSTPKKKIVKKKSAKKKTDSTDIEPVSEGEKDPKPVEPEEDIVRKSIEAAKAKIKTLGAPGSIVDGKVDNSNLRSVISSIPNNDDKIKVAVKRESDIKKAELLIDDLYPNRDIFVVLKPNIGADCVWRKVVS